MKTIGTFEILVHFEDLDAGGVVHHPNYLKICERARNQWLAPLGLDTHSLLKEDFALAVRTIEAEYKKPLEAGKVFVELKIEETSSKSIRIAHAISENRESLPVFHAEILFVGIKVSTRTSCLLPNALMECVGTS